MDNVVRQKVYPNFETPEQMYDYFQGTYTPYTLVDCARMLHQNHVAMDIEKNKKTVLLELQDN